MTKDVTQRQCVSVQQSVTYWSFDKKRRLLWIRYTFRQTKIVVDQLDRLRLTIQFIKQMGYILCRTYCDQREFGPLSKGGNHHFKNIGGDKLQVTTENIIVSRIMTFSQKRPSTTKKKKKKNCTLGFLTSRLFLGSFILV